MSFNLKKLQAPTIILFIITVLAILKLNYDYFMTEEEDNKNQIPYMFIIGIKGIIFMYVCYCLSEGNCNVLSWLVAITIGLYIVFFIAILSKIPISKLEMIDKCHNKCTETLLFN
jgi:hypothetical protein